MLHRFEAHTRKPSCLYLLCIFILLIGFKRNIEKDIKGDTSGDFKRLMVRILQANRSDEQTLDEALVEQDVKELHKVGILQIREGRNVTKADQTLVEQVSDMSFKGMNT